MGRRVFISYAHKDRDVASGLAKALEDHAVVAWWDTNLVAGEVFPDVLMREIDRSDAVLVLWSSASVTSRFVRDEAERGLSQNKLIPISVDGTNPPLGFGGLQTIFFVDNCLDDLAPILEALDRQGAAGDDRKSDQIAAVARRPAGSRNEINNLDYVKYHSDVLGLSFEYPSAILTLDTTRADDGHFELISLSNETEAKVILSPKPVHGDIQWGRRIERELLESNGCRITYFGPQMEKNWGDWYVLSGIGPDGRRFYVRRWYKDRGTISFEFSFSGERIPIFNSVIHEMTINRITFD